MTVSLKCVQRCLCVPPQHRVKHLCMVFLQFALARLQWERDQAAATTLPPELALKPQEKLEQLLWFGFGAFLYRLPALKLALTLTCQICGHVSRCTNAMNPWLLKAPPSGNSCDGLCSRTLDVYATRQGAMGFRVTLVLHFFRRQCWQFRHIGSC